MDDVYLTKISDILRESSKNKLNIFDFANSFSQTQLDSKKWLIKTLLTQKFKPNPSILVLGGWYGSYLVPFIQQDIKPLHIYFNDIEQSYLNVALKLHKARNISFHCFDATKQYDLFDVDIVINTSCEHMNSYSQMLKTGSDTLFVLQSCDNTNDPGHINASKNTEHFISKVGLNKIFVKSRLNLGHKNRFMIIGKI